MTKKHFEAVARLIKWRYGYDMSTIDFDAGYNKAVADIADDLADYFETVNPLFDRNRFLTACGVV